MQSEHGGQRSFHTVDLHCKEQEREDQNSLSLPSVVCAKSLNPLNPLAPHSAVFPKDFCEVERQ